MRYRDIISEVLDTPAVLHRIPEDVFAQKFSGISWNKIRMAFWTSINEERYLIYFMTPSNKALDEYTCNFGKMNDRGGMAFEPTGTGSAFAVYSAVGIAIELFLKEFQPYILNMVGQVSKQSRLYGIIFRHLKSRFPGYFLWQSPHGTLSLFRRGVGETNTETEAEASDKAA